MSLRLICATVPILLFAGCKVAPKARPAAEAPAATQPASLTLRPGDTLELRFFYAPELNDGQTIRPDGKLSLQLVGEVDAAGKTPGQLAETLTTLYGAHLKYPNVSVVIRSMYQRKVYVAGEVLQPGLVELPGEMSVLEAIMNRGGFNMTTAETASVIVMRYENGERRGYKVNLKDAMQGGTEEQFALQPQDIVYVPRTAVVNVNQFLEQYVRNMIPQTGFVYTTSVGNDGTLGIDTSRN